MRYIGWPANVNRRIIDSTTVTAGEGATITDQIEGSGASRSRMTCISPKDRFSVVMHFNWSETGGDGVTEYQRFMSWYRNVHKCGENPFEFPSILFNTDNRLSYSEEEIARGNVPQSEFYCIKSTAEGAKHGFDVEVRMTWETFATGVYEVEYKRAVVNGTQFKNGYIAVSLATAPDSMPTSANFSLTVDGIQTPIGVYFNEGGPTLVYVTYPKISAAGMHTLRLSLSGVYRANGIPETIERQVNV